jgi:hypothetical protein
VEEGGWGVCCNFDEAALAADAAFAFAFRVGEPRGLMNREVSSKREHDRSRRERGKAAETIRGVSVDRPWHEGAWRPRKPCDPTSSRAALVLPELAGSGPRCIKL